MKSITTYDQQFIAVTTTILANNAKRDDFELASDFLLLAAAQKQCGGNEQQRVSAIYQGQQQDKLKQKDKFQVGKTGVEFCYYQKMEFDQITQEQKEKLRQHREINKHQNKDVGGSNEQRILEMEKILEDKSHIISALRADRDTPTLPPPTPSVS